MTTINDVVKFKYDSMADDKMLIPLEYPKTMPFPIKRIFYVHSIPDTDNRGNHANITSEQIIICLTGRINVTCRDGISMQQWSLWQNDAIYVPKMIWDEESFCTPETIMLSLNSTIYSRDYYIEDFDIFKQLKRTDKSWGS
jgi:hypothetical protein